MYDKATPTSDAAAGAGMTIMGGDRANIVQPVPRIFAQA